MNLDLGLVGQLKVGWIRCPITFRCTSSSLPVNMFIEKLLRVATALIHWASSRARHDSQVQHESVEPTSQSMRCSVTVRAVFFIFALLVSAADTITFVAR